jgi:hypothetical protein
LLGTTGGSAVPLALCLSRRRLPFPHLDAHVLHLGNGVFPRGLNLL